jgi:hypothetical protein
MADNATLAESCLRTLLNPSHQDSQRSLLSTELRCLDEIAMPSASYMPGNDDPGARTLPRLNEARTTSPLIHLLTGTNPSQAALSHILSWCDVLDSFMFASTSKVVRAHVQAATTFDSVTTWELPKVDSADVKAFANSWPNACGLHTLGEWTAKSFRTGWCNTASMFR